MKKENKYFSFIGSVWCYEVNEQQLGEELHCVNMGYDYISIHQHPKVESLVIIVQSIHNPAEGDCEAYSDRRYYIAHRNAFNCDPCVPNPIFKDSLELALSR